MTNNVRKSCTASQSANVVPAGTRQVGSGATPCSHDFENCVRKGRARYHCPKCGADISFELVLIAEIDSENTKLDDAERSS